MISLFIKLSPARDRDLYHKIIDYQDQEQEEIFHLTKEERVKTRKQKDKLHYLKEYTELCNDEIQFLINANEKGAFSSMNKFQILFDKKIEIKNNVKKTIKNKILKKSIIRKLDNLHDHYANIIRQLIYDGNLGRSA